jgi:hypothetical protein
MSTVSPQPQQPQAAPPPAAAPAQPHGVEAQPMDPGRLQLRIYSHSNLVYWWPVWAFGYLVALLTWLNGKPVEFGDHSELVLMHQVWGVAFTVLLFGVIFFTNVLLRGTASVVAVVAVLFLVVLLAYLGLWDYILSWLPHLSVHMNMGFYIFFSTLVFLLWAGSFFIYDRLTYYVIRPGQIIQDHVIGGAQKSYNTQGMVFEKNRQDLFRQWLLGLGAGDLRISTMGAKREELYIPNVLFVDWKVQAIQKMIATRPAEFATPGVV